MQVILLCNSNQLKIVISIIIPMQLFLHWIKCSNYSFLLYFQKAGKNCKIGYFFLVLIQVYLSSFIFLGKIIFEDRIQTSFQEIASKDRLFIHVKNTVTLEAVHKLTMSSQNRQYLMQKQIILNSTSKKNPHYCVKDCW